MSTYTIPAGVELPTEVGATIHLAVPGEPFSVMYHRVLNGDHEIAPPPVLADLVRKECETCDDGLLCPDECWACTGEACWKCGRLPDPPCECDVTDRHADDPCSDICQDCAGSGSALVDLVRECQNRYCDNGMCRDDTGRGVAYCAVCNAGIVSLGRWKVKALEPDGTGGYVATLELVVAP